MSNKICQSCGMPFANEKQFGTNKDVSALVRILTVIAL